MCSSGLYDVKTTLRCFERKAPKVTGLEGMSCEEGLRPLFSTGGQEVTSVLSAAL